MNIPCSNKTITLPAEISDERLDHILGIIHLIDSGTETITLDFKNNTKISAAGYAIMMTMIDAACEQKTTLVVINTNPHNKFHRKIKELCERISKNFNFHKIEEMNFIQEQSINWGKVSSIAPEIIEKIDKKFSGIINEDSLWNIKLILNELMQNAVDHSTSERYFIYAGINENSFELGVLDRGVTIPAKLAAKYNCDNDHQFLELSVQLEIGTRRNRKGGMGLYYLFENLKNEKGKLLIISRNGQLRRHFNARTVIAKATKFPLKGTWCMGRIPLEKEK